jgi:hypothetical protein
MSPEPDAGIKPVGGAKADGPENFRRLNWDEQVKRGDFVEDGQQGFELWTGMVGFRADTFLKTIYRRTKVQS